MPVKLTSLSLSALPSPSDRQFRNQNQLVEPDSVFSQEFIEQAYDRLVSGLHYSAWAHQLKLSWIGDAAGYGARFGLHALGRKINLLRRLPFLDVSQLLSDEIVSGYVTQQYRVEDQGNHAWRNEVIEGLIARGLTLGSTHALKGLGFLLTGARGLAVQGLFMGMGLLIGEQVTTRLLHSKIQTAGSFAGVLLRLFDTQLMMAKGRVMKPLMLDEPLARVEQRFTDLSLRGDRRETRQSRSTPGLPRSLRSLAMTNRKFFAGDQHQVKGETSGVITGGIPESKALVHQPKERQSFPTRVTTDSGQRLVSTMSQQECHTALATYKRNARACLMILYENGFITRDVYQTLNQRLSSQHDRERAQARTFIRLYGALVRGSREITGQRLFRNVIESNGWQLTADHGRYSLVGEPAYHEAVRLEDIDAPPKPTSEPTLKTDEIIPSDETALALITEDTPETGIAQRLKDALSTQKQSDIIPNKNLAERIADYISQGQFRRAASLLEAIHSPQVCTRLFQAFGGLDSIQGYDHPIDPALMARVWQHMSPEATARILITLNHQAEQDSRRSPYPDAVEIELFDEWTLNILAWMQIDKLDSPSPQAQPNEGPLSRTAVIFGSLAEHPDSRSFATRLITRGLQPEHTAYDAIAHTVHELSESVPGFLSLQQIIATDYTQVCQSGWWQRRNSVLPQPSTSLFDQNAKLADLKQRLNQHDPQDETATTLLSDTLLLTFPPATARELLADHGGLDTLSQLLRHQTPETASAFLGLWGAQKTHESHDIERAHVLHHLWEQKDGQTYVEQTIRCAAEDPDATASVQRALHLETTDALVPPYLKAGMEDLYIDLASPDIPGPLVDTINTPEDFMDTGVLKPEDLIGEHQQRALDRILVHLQTSDQDTQARACDLLVRIAQAGDYDLPPITSWSQQPAEKAAEYVKQLFAPSPFKACIDYLMGHLPPKGDDRGFVFRKNLYWRTLCQMGNIAEKERRAYYDSFRDRLALSTRVKRFGLVCPETAQEALDYLSQPYRSLSSFFLETLSDQYLYVFDLMDRFIQLGHTSLTGPAFSLSIGQMVNVLNMFLQVYQSCARDPQKATVAHQRLQQVYVHLSDLSLSKPEIRAVFFISNFIYTLAALEQANPDNDRAYPVYLDILAREGLGNVVPNPQTVEDSYRPATKEALKRLQTDGGLEQSSPAILDYITDSDKPVAQRAQVFHRLASVTDKPLAGVARDDLHDDLLVELFKQDWGDHTQGALLLPPDILAAELDQAVKGQPPYQDKANGDTLVELLDKTADQPGSLTRDQADAAMFDLAASGRAAFDVVDDKIVTRQTNLYGQAVYRILCGRDYSQTVRQATYDSLLQLARPVKQHDSPLSFAAWLEPDQYTQFYQAIIDFKTEQGRSRDYPWTPYHIIAAFQSESSSDFLVEQGLKLVGMSEQPGSLRQLADLTHALVQVNSPNPKFLKQNLVRFYYDALVMVSQRDKFPTPYVPETVLHYDSEGFDYRAIALRAQMGLYQFGKEGVPVLESVLTADERQAAVSLLSPETDQWKKGAERRGKFGRDSTADDIVPRMAYNIKGLFVFESDMVAICQHLEIPLTSLYG